MLNLMSFNFFRSDLMSRQTETNGAFNDVSKVNGVVANSEQHEQSHSKRNGRHFYASKVNSNGKELVFGFDKVEDRNNWMQKRNDSKILKANDVYKILNRKKDEVVIASNTRRLHVIKADKLDDELRQHVVMS